VTSHQLQEGLRTYLGATADGESVRRFMRIFDKDGDDDLTYQEFCDAFLPIDTQLANDLAVQPPQEKFRTVDFGSDAEMFSYRMAMFAPATRAAFVAVWRTHFWICDTLA
jgi:Ca2+-binding EF-hand superfamily protein